MPLKCWMGKETSSLPFYKTKDLAGVWCPDDSTTGMAFQLRTLFLCALEKPKHNNIQILNVIILVRLIVETKCVLQINKSPYTIK